MDRNFILKELQSLKVYKGNVLKRAVGPEIECRIKKVTL
jgi:hypothetical protein